MKKKLNVKKKYYGILRYGFTNQKKEDIFNFVENYQVCDCSEAGIKLFESKEEAKEEMRNNEIPDIMVEFTSKILK